MPNLRSRHDARSTRSAVEVLIYYGCGVAAAIQVGVMPPLLPALRQSFAADNALLGLSASLITGAGAVLAIAAGRWIAGRDLRRITRAGALLLAAGVLLTALAPTLVWLLAGRLVAGTGYLALVVAAPAAMYRVAGPAHGARAMALWATFIPVGLAAGSLAAAWLVTVWDWRLALAVSALPALLGAAALGLCRPLPVSALSGDADGAVGPVFWKEPTLLAMVAAFGLFAGGSQAAILFLPSLLVDLAGWDTAAAGSLLAAGTLAGGIVGSLAAGLLIGRWVRGPELFGLSALVLAVALLAVFCAGPWQTGVLLLVLLFAMHGLAGGAGFASLPAWAETGRPMALLQGLLAQTAEVCVLTLPGLAGLAVDRAGWNAAGLVVALPVLAAAGLAFYAGRFRRKVATVNRADRAARGPSHCA